MCASVDVCLYVCMVVDVCMCVRPSMFLDTCVSVHMCARVYMGTSVGHDLNCMFSVPCLFLSLFLFVVDRLQMLRPVLWVVQASNGICGGSYSNKNEVGNGKCELACNIAECFFDGTYFIPVRLCVPVLHVYRSVDEEYTLRGCMREWMCVYLEGCVYVYACVRMYMF